ncbi:MAG: gliding motility-associated C-terminal domain-containing protein [Bacteroidota bacterium]
MKALLFCIISTFSLSIAAQEICDNGQDDDGDGLIDIQDPDCNCAESFSAVSADFEEFSCCPQNFTGADPGFNCLEDGWTFAGVGSTDYFNTCGFLGSGAIPNIPQPLPSGNGAIGSLAGNSIVSGPFDEPIARCLDCSFIAGETYDINFFVGFNTTGGISSPNVEISIFGKSDCSNIPSSVPGCPVDAGWTEMATFSVNSVANDWVEVNGSFISPGDFSAVAIGRNCDYLNSLSTIGIQYHFFDAIEITGIYSGTNCGSPIASITTDVSGDCNNGFLLSANSLQPVQFQWYLDGIAIPGATASTWFVDPLEPGNYQVRAVDSNGSCGISDPVEIVTDLDATINLIEINPTCPGDSDGSIELVIDDPNTTLDIDWNTGDDSLFLDGIGADTYMVTITDSNGCSEDRTIVLDDPEPLVSAASLTQPVCQNDATGVIEITVSTGVAPFTFNWSTGSDSTAVTNLSADIYELTITDAGGCAYESSYEIIEPDEFEIDSLITINDCFGGSEASIEIVPPAVGTYTAEWNTNDTGLSLNNLQAGNYSVSVTSELGCVQEYAFEIVDEVAPIAISLVVEDPVCGFENGSISTSVSGGNGPFIFDWGTAGNGADLTDLGDGNYSLLVTDQTGCTATIDTNLLPYPELTNSSNVVEPSCAGDATATISLTPDGGTAPYAFSWSNSETDPEIEGLTADDYEVTITDALGCELVESFTIIEPEPLQLDQNITQPLCFGDLANVVFGPSGGSGTYTFSGDLTGAALTYDLPIGQYNFELSDANGCTLPGAIEIIEPEVLSSAVTSVTDPDLGVANGQISAEASGGTPPYTFEWSNGDTGADIDGLGPGTYTAVVTDANGCQTTISATLIQPVQLSFSIGSTDNLCSGTCTGTISLQLAGGTEPYTVSWSDGQSGPLATDLCNGQYRAEIIDANGNSIMTDFVAITSPDALEIVSSDITAVSCINITDGSIAVDLSGGTAPYSYSWNSETGGPLLSNLEAGTYELQATDANGCPITETFTVEDYELREFGFSSAVTNCDFDEYEIVIFDPQLDEIDWLLNGEPAAINGLGVLRGLSPGSYELSYEETTGCRVAVETFNFDGLAPYQLIVDESPREVEFGDVVELEVFSSPLDQIESEGVVVWSSINPFDCVNGPLENCRIIELTAESSEVVEFTYLDDLGCLTEFRIPIFVSEPQYAYVPSSFSPNNDGVNDDFMLFTTDFVESVISSRVYDRWGNEVSEASDLRPGETVLWDGRVNGRNTQVGVYVYAAILRLANGEEVVLKGDVTLIR